MAFPRGNGENQCIEVSKGNWERTEYLGIMGIEVSRKVGAVGGIR